LRKRQTLFNGNSYIKSLLRKVIEYKSTVIRSNSDVKSQLIQIAINTFPFLALYIPNIIEGDWKTSRTILITSIVINSISCMQGLYSGQNFRKKLLQINQFNWVIPATEKNQIRTALQFLPIHIKEVTVYRIYSFLPHIWCAYVVFGYTYSRKGGLFVDITTLSIGSYVWLSTSVSKK